MVCICCESCRSRGCSPDVVLDSLMAGLARPFEKPGRGGAKSMADRGGMLIERGSAPLLARTVLSLLRFGSDWRARSSTELRCMDGLMLRDTGSLGEALCGCWPYWLERPCDEWRCCTLAGGINVLPVALSTAKDTRFELSLGLPWSGPGLGDRTVTLPSSDMSMCIPEGSPSLANVCVLPSGPTTRTVSPTEMRVPSPRIIWLGPPVVRLS